MPAAQGSTSAAKKGASCLRPLSVNWTWYHTGIARTSELTIWVHKCLSDAQRLRSSQELSFYTSSAVTLDWEIDWQHYGAGGGLRINIYIASIKPAAPVATCNSEGSFGIIEKHVQNHNVFQESKLCLLWTARKQLPSLHLCHFSIIFMKRPQCISRTVLLFSCWYRYWHKGK